MRRQDKYPDTEYFKFDNVNGHGRLTEDCIHRALTSVLQKPYNDVVMELAQLQCETGYADVRLAGIYLERHGFIKMLCPRDNGRQLTGKEFCKSSFTSIYTHIFANIGAGHVTAIVDGKIHDTWDCSDYCIGNYWVQKSNDKTA